MGMACQMVVVQLKSWNGIKQYFWYFFLNGYTDMFAIIFCLKIKIHINTYKYSLDYYI